MKNYKWLSILLSGVLVLSLMTACKKGPTEEELKEKQERISKKIDQVEKGESAQDETKDKESGDEETETTPAVTMEELSDEVKEGPFYDFGVALFKMDTDKILSLIDITDGLVPEKKSFEDLFYADDFFNSGFASDPDKYMVRVVKHPKNGEVRVYQKDTPDSIAIFDFEVRNDKPALTNQEGTLKINDFYNIPFSLNDKTLQLKDSGKSGNVTQYDIEHLLPGNYKLKFGPNIYGFGEYEVDRDTGWSCFDYSNDSGKAYLSDESFTKFEAAIKEFFESFAPKLGGKEAVKPEDLKASKLTAEQLTKITEALHKKFAEGGFGQNWKGDGSDKIENISIEDVYNIGDAGFNTVECTVEVSADFNGESSTFGYFDTELQADDQQNFFVTKLEIH